MSGRPLIGRPDILNRVLLPLPSSHRELPAGRHRRRWAQAPSRDQGRQEPSSPRLTRTRGPARRNRPGRYSRAGSWQARLSTPETTDRLSSSVGNREQALGTRRPTDAVSLSPGLRMARRERTLQPALRHCFVSARAVPKVNSMLPYSIDKTLLSIAVQVHVHDASQGNCVASLEQEQRGPGVNHLRQF